MESRIEPGLAPPPGYAHTVTVEAGERLVFAAGAVPIDQSGSLVGAGDIRAQTRAVLDNLAEALRGAGTGLDRVVATTVYVVAAEQADLATVWGRCGRRTSASDRIPPHCSGSPSSGTPVNLSRSLRWRWPRLAERFASDHFTPDDWDVALLQKVASHFVEAHPLNRVDFEHRRVEVVGSDFCQLGAGHYIETSPLIASSRAGMVALA